MHEKWWIPFVNFSSTHYCPSSTPTHGHTLPLVIKQGSKPLTLLANNEWSGKIGTLLAISLDCQEAHGGPVRFQWWQDRLTSWTLFFIFLSFFILFSVDINKMKPIYMNPQTHKWSFQNIRFCVLDWAIYCFFFDKSMVVLDLGGKGKHLKMNRPLCCNVHFLQPEIKQICISYIKRLAFCASAGLWSECKHQAKWYNTGHA